jgi:hypothetical protein
VPAVSGDPIQYYPTTDYSSKEGNWPNISKTSHPEGTKGGTQRKYSTNPNYQASLNKLYYHWVLTETEQRELKEEAPNNIQTYIEPKKWVQLLSLASALYLSSQRSPFCHFEKTLHFKLKTTGPSLSTSSRRGADASLTTSS